MIPHWKQKFVLLWTGQALSILSSMVSQYALIWYLTDLTGSPAVLSLATMAAMVPQGVLSLFTGAFADRFDRRIIMMVSDGAIGLISLALAALAFAGPLPVAPILAVAALRSVGGAFHAPCIQAVTPLIAPPESLTRCAGWSQGIQTVSMLLSPALASVLYAHVPLAWILLLDTLGAVFAIGGVLLARLPVLRAGGPRGPPRRGAGPTGGRGGATLCPGGGGRVNDRGGDSPRRPGGGAPAAGGEPRGHCGGFV